MARKYKWFPLFHIINTFFIAPMIFLGLSILFEQGTIGIVFGIIICILILILIIKITYWYYFQEGKIFINNRLDIIEDSNNQKDNN